MLEVLSAIIDFIAEYVFAIMVGGFLFLVAMAQIIKLSKLRKLLSQNTVKVTATINKRTRDRVDELFQNSPSGTPPVRRVYYKFVDEFGKSRKGCYQDTYISWNKNEYQPGEKIQVSYLMSNPHINYPTDKIASSIKTTRSNLITGCLVAPILLIIFLIYTKNHD